MWRYLLPILDLSIPGIFFGWRGLHSLRTSNRHRLMLAKACLLDFWCPFFSRVPCTLTHNCKLVSCEGMPTCSSCPCLSPPLEPQDLPFCLSTARLTPSDHPAPPASFAAHALILRPCPNASDGTFGWRQNYASAAASSLPHRLPSCRISGPQQSRFGELQRWVQELR